MLEYSLIKQHQPRFNVRLRDDKSYPFLAVTVDERVAAGARHARPQAQGHPLLRAVRPRLRHPRHARRAAALVPDPDLQPVQVPRPRAARPAVPAVPHREVLGAVRRRDRRGRPTASSSTSCATSSTATPTPIVKRLDAEMRGAADGAGVREGGPRPRPPGHRAAGHRAPADGGRAHRGPRRDRAGRGRAGGRRCRCSTSAGGGSSGARGSSSTRSRTLTPGRPGRPDPRAPLRRRSAAGRAQAGARARRRRRTSSRTRSGCRCSGARGCRSGCPSGATSGPCWRRSPATPRRSSPATACAGPATTTRRSRALNELQDAPRPARGAAAHRVLRHGPPPGHRLRRLDGGAGGRAARTSASTAGSRCTCRGQRRLRGDGGGAHPAAHRLPRRARPAAAGAGRAAAASSPTRRSCCSSTAARASSAWPSGSCDALGLEDEIPVAGAGQAVRGGLRARARPTRSTIPRGSEALFMLQRIRDEAHRFANTFHGERRSKRMTAQRRSTTSPASARPARSGW